MKEEYKKYLEEKVAPYINEIAKERDYTDSKQVRELFRCVKEIMCCETVAYFTRRAFHYDQFFIPKGFLYSEANFPPKMKLSHGNYFIQKPLVTGKYLLMDTRTLDKIGPPFEELGIQSVLAVPTEKEFLYGVLFAFNGLGIEKSPFNLSFNVFQCNLFLLISKIIDFPTSYEINLSKDIRAIKDEPLLEYFFNKLASLQGDEELVDGIMTCYRRNKEISFIFLTQTRILSIIQKGKESKCSSFFFKDIVSINQQSRYERDKEKLDIELEFSKGSIKWEDADATYYTKHFIKNIQNLAKIEG